MDVSTLESLHCSWRSLHYNTRVWTAPGRVWTAVAYAALVLIYTTDACAGTQNCLHTVLELHLDLSSLQSPVLHLDGFPLQGPKLNLVLSGQQLPACAAPRLSIYYRDLCCTWMCLHTGLHLDVSTLQILWCTRMCFLYRGLSCTWIWPQYRVPCCT